MQSQMLINGKIKLEMSLDNKSISTYNGAFNIEVFFILPQT